MGVGVRPLLIRNAERLGLFNRMHLAKRINRLTYGKLQLERERYFQARRAFFETNARLHLADGWALDQSRSAAHLDEVLSAATTVLDRILNRSAGLKRHMRNCLGAQELRDYPAFFRFAAEPSLHAAAALYLGCMPVLSSVKLLVSSPPEASQAVTKFHSSQLFHLDHADIRQVKIVVAVDDIDDGTGPFCFLPAAASAKAVDRLGYGRFNAGYRVADDDMKDVLDNLDELVKFVGQRGDILLVDTSSCFHYGSRNQIRARHVLMYQYISAIRADFRRVDYSKFLNSNDNSLMAGLLDPRHRFTSEDAPISGIA